MTTNRFHDDASERDNNLVSALCHTMRHDMLRDFREWIEAELKALLTEAQIQRAETQGALGEELDGAIERLSLLSRTTLPSAVRDYTNMVHDIREGTWSDVYDAYDPMRQELGKLVDIVRILLEMRNFIMPVPEE